MILLLILAMIGALAVVVVIASFLDLDAVRARRAAEEAARAELREEQRFHAKYRRFYPGTKP